MKQTIGILGAGGHAREVASYSPRKIEFFAVESKYLEVGLINIEEPNDDQINCEVVAAIGSPLVRKKIVESWPGKNFTNVISQSCYVGEDIKLGKGIQIAPHAAITNGCTIGDHTTINTAATVSHDCSIGEYVTISPGAHLGGKVHVSDGAFIGIGAIIKNGVFIASGVVVGAGAVLLRDAVVENGVYFGNPARLSRTNVEWLSVV